jgi:bifunctional DNA-binding transcriptional regulator/antitoxin component of YhaV-PrlF toxin-antitoxin module
VGYSHLPTVPQRLNSSVRGETMNLVTVDSKRRVTLPKELDIKPGQVLGVNINGDHVEFYPVQIVPMDEFKRVMASVSEEHKAAFERLAK